MEHIWISHATHRNESCHAQDSALSYIGRSRTYVNQLRHTQEWETSRTGISHITYREKSWNTYESVTPRTGMSHITHRNKSNDIYVMEHMCVINEMRWLKMRSHIFLIFRSHGTHMGDFSFSITFPWLFHYFYVSWNTYFSLLEVMEHTFSSDFSMTFPWRFHDVSMTSVCVMEHICVPWLHIHLLSSHL